MWIQRTLCRLKMGVWDEAGGAGGSDSNNDSNGNDGTQNSANSSESGNSDDQNGSGDSGDQGNKDWRDSIDSNIASDPSLQKFKDVGSLAKSYLEIQKVVGRKTDIPKQDATPDQWREFYHKIGLPKEESEYKINPVDGVDNVGIQAFTKAAFEAGIMPLQAQKMLTHMSEQSKQWKQNQSDSILQEIQENTETIKKEWGINFSDNIGNIQRAVKYFGGEQALEKIKSSPLGSDPDVLRMLKSISDTVREDVISSNNMTVGTKESNEARLNEIYASPDYYNAKSPNHNKLVNEVEIIMRQMFPDS